MKTLLLFVKTAGILYLGMLCFLYFMQERLLFPAPEPIGFTVSGNAERVEISTADGHTLKAIYFPATSSAGNVVFFHGNGSLAETEIERGQALHAVGYGVLLAEYRGYGGSTGKPSSAGMAVDALAAHDWLQAKSDTPLIVYAHSLGTGFAVQVAAQRDVAALVLEAPYSSLGDVVASHYPWVPVKLLFRHSVRAIDFIGNVRAPILMIHGERDTVIPISFGRSLFEAAGNNAQWIALKEAGHNSLIAYGSIDLVLKFLGANVGSYEQGQNGLPG